MRNIQDLSAPAQAVYNAMRAAALPTTQTIANQTWCAFYTSDFHKSLIAGQQLQPIYGFNPHNVRQVANYLAVLNRRGVYVGDRMMPMARVRVS